MRRFLVILITLLACAGLWTVPAAATPSYCGLTWGSLDKSDPEYSSATLTNVRSGRHECFDRLVIDLTGPVAGYLVRYVDTVAEDGSGAPVPLRGSAFLQVTVHAPAYDDGGLTYLPADRAELVDVTGYPTFRQVAWAVSFEGQSNLGIGVRARLPFRVFTLDGPARVVIDVAHRW
ncbi:AMIN-like domain-containing (lipo)protein [Nocardia rhizosphaerae]|uniref:AMIN-like domain-containing protein n=1 Tax=Nocardia rhizosphaerae TaxID=1691571 RepID=A0ABV8L6I4_9NOCA